MEKKRKEEEKLEKEREKKRKENEKSRGILAVFLDSSALQVSKFQL